MEKRVRFKKILFKVNSINKFFILVIRKGHYIYEQLKALGGSYDWDRAVFTMDPVKKHIFRADRIKSGENFVIFC